MEKSHLYFLQGASDFQSPIYNKVINIKEYYYVERSYQSAYVLTQFVSILWEINVELFGRLRAYIF